LLNSACVRWFAVVYFIAVTACTAELVPDPDRADEAADAAPSTARGNIAPSRAQVDVNPAHDRSRSARPAASMAPTDAGAQSDAEPQRSPLADGGTISARAPDAQTETLDAGPAGDALATLPPPIHRYDFEGSGTIASDAIAGADGVLFGGAQLAQGGVVMDGVDDFIRLPPGLLSSLSSATLLAWLRWDGGPCWQRVFDFGATATVLADDGLYLSLDVVSSLYLSPAACPDNTPAIGSIDSQRKEHVAGPRPLAAPTTLQVGLVFDGDARTLRLVVDGVVAVEGPTRMQLANLRDEIALLGRSLYASDPPLVGELVEFRIYDRALETETLSAIYAAGPDAL
jgi:Concanavalin A-like lectin/glucanases superfamily